MTHLVLPRLIGLLTNHSMRLYDLFTMSRNNDISEGIDKERQRIIRIITTLETLLEGSAIYEDEVSLDDDSSDIDKADADRVQEE